MVILRRRRSTLFIVILIVCAIVLISLQISGRYEGDPLHNLVLRVIAPPQRVFHWGIASIRSVLQNYILLVDLKQENLRLQEEVRRLQLANNDLKESVYAVERLQRP